MATSQAQKNATKKYREKTYDTIGFDVRKGKRDEYKQFAAKKGWSLAGLLTKATDDFILNNGGDLPTPDKQQARKSLSPADERLLDDLAKLPTDAQKAFRQLVRAITAPANDDNQPDRRRSK